MYKLGKLLNFYFLFLGNKCFWIDLFNVDLLQIKKVFYFRSMCYVEVFGEIESSIMVVGCSFGVQELFELGIVDGGGSFFGVFGSFGFMKLGVIGYDDIYFVIYVGCDIDYKIGYQVMVLDIMINSIGVLFFLWGIVGEIGFYFGQVIIVIGIGGEFGCMFVIGVLII